MDHPVPIDARTASDAGGLCGSLCFQNIGDELDDLPEGCGAPRGGLLYLYPPAGR